MSKGEDKIIECLKLVKSYKKKRVVDNLSFSVKNGEDFDELEKRCWDQAEK